VRSAKPGRHADGNGLYLEVDESGARRWMVRLMVQGRRRDIGLGPTSLVSLAEARNTTIDIRRLARDGGDPLAERRRARRVVPSFAEAARTCHEEHKGSWKNGKHTDQWLNTLETYAFPLIGTMSVAQVGGPEVRDVLLPIWLEKPETARRLRQRIGTVLDWAIAKGVREGENPVRSVVKGLPKQKDRTEHFAALPYEEVPGFLSLLRETEKAGPVVKGLFELVVLTAVRSGEARNARWNEIDLRTKLWTIPAERMKAGRPHTVPLSARAIAVLEEAAKHRKSDDSAALVFPGERTGKPMSDMTLTALLRRLELKATAHGFRSSFRDWCAEATTFPREVAEAALAHALESKVEAAYRRSDLLEKRRKLMDAWAGFCDGRTANKGDSCGRATR